MAVFGESWDDPKTALWLTLASGLLSGRGNLAQNLGDGLLGGLKGYGATKKLHNDLATADMQRKLYQSQLDENKAQAEARRAAMERQTQIDKAFAGVVQRPYMGADQGPPIPPELARPVVDRGAFESAMSQYFPRDYIDYLEKQKPPKPASNNALEILDAVYPPGHPERARAMKDLAVKTTTHPPIAGVTTIQEPGKQNPSVITYDRNGNLIRTLGNKPPPAGAVRFPPVALRQQQELLEDMQLASSINADMGSLVSQIDTGALNLGLVKNAVSRVRNAMGMGTPESVKYSSAKATLEKMRNDSLRLNKGAQTEGDAVRAWNELFEFMSDPQVVRERLTEIQALNRRAANQKELMVETLRKQYGQESMDFAPFRNQSSALDGGSPSGGQAGQPSANSASLRQQAQDAIARGADRSAVAKRFKEQTGQDL